MSKYESLKYKLAEGSNPAGKPKVYFCCHKDDFADRFEEITDEILEIQTNAVIWYHEPTEENADIFYEEEFYSDLAQMQLFVIPVTAKFIYEKNAARENEFAFAIKQHIPVLPLMQESDLETDFNRICGDLQYLNKHDEDPTAIPYKDKLKKFLEAVLVSDDMAQKIRDAFDSYIFLSYRKKDRKYAKELMNLIHQNDFCRDIAIWYDEFLTPGENFNDAIAKALEKSDLFTLSVTPNLLEDMNYVMTTEYPEALKSGKPILAIEMVDTDHDKMRTCYKGINKPISKKNPDRLSQILFEELKADEQYGKKSDPKHLFFMGLAYLSGIDVEVNHERGLELITQAAKGGLAEAHEKLADMYYYGDGVERDYKIAASWREKHAMLMESMLENPLESRLLVSLYWHVGDEFKDLKLPQKALNDYKKMADYAYKRYEQEKTRENLRDYSVALNKIGKIYLGEDDLETAIPFFEETIKIREILTADKASSRAHRDLTIVYNEMAELLRKSGKMDQAKAYLKKSLAIRKKIAELDESPKNFKDLSTIYNKLADLYTDNLQFDEAEPLYQEALKIRLKLVDEKQNSETVSSLALSYSKLGKLYKEKKEWTSAREYTVKCLELRETLVKEVENLSAYRGLTITLNTLGDIWKEEGNLSEAKSCYERSLAIREKLAGDADSVSVIRDVTVVLNKLGDIHKALEDTDGAMECYKKGLPLREGIVSKSGSVSNRKNLTLSYNKIADIYKAKSMLDEARAYYLKSLKIREELAEETRLVKYKQDLALLLERLGNLEKLCKSYEESKGYYERALILRREVAKKLGSSDAKAKAEKCRKLLDQVSELI